VEETHPVKQLTSSSLGTRSGATNAFVCGFLVGSLTAPHPVFGLSHKFLLASCLASQKLHNNWFPQNSPSRSSQHDCSLKFLLAHGVGQQRETFLKQGFRLLVAWRDTHYTPGHRSSSRDVTSVACTYGFFVHMCSFGRAIRA